MVMYREVCPEGVQNKCPGGVWCRGFMSWGDTLILIISRGVQLYYGIAQHFLLQFFPQLCFQACLPKLQFHPCWLLQQGAVCLTCLVLHNTVQIQTLYCRHPGANVVQQLFHAYG